MGLHWLESGPVDRKPAPGALWNRLRPAEQSAILETALEQPDLSLRELACQVTDHAGFTVSEATVYRMLKRQGRNRTITLVGFPAGKEFRVKTTAPTNCGSPTPVTISWRVGVGITRSKCSTITRALCWPAI
jgi:hypothetical protein